MQVKVAEENAMTLDQLELPKIDWYDTPAPSPTALRPLSSQERLPLVDALRGFAILGVLLAYTLWNLGSPPAEQWSALDRAIDFVGAAFVDTKFLTTFAFLFGAGTAHQWWRARLRGVNVAGFHARRMLFLLVVGLAHGALLRNGDILAPYALMGLMLLAVRKATARQLIVIAILLALLPYGVRPVMKAAGLSFIGRPELQRSQSYLAANFVWLRYWYATNTLTEWPRILAVMMAGVWAERTGFIDRLAMSRRFALRVLIGAATVAVVSYGLVYVIAFIWKAERAPMVRMPVLSQTFYLSAWSLAAAYAAAFALLCRRPGWLARLGWLRSVGRMAFTNYLLQASLVVPACLVFGWFDTVTPSRGVLLALAVMSIQIPFSVWWLNRFEYGPVELLWRNATYGRR
jgi:uncharacterized protein